MSQLTLFFFGPPRAVQVEQEIDIGLSKGWALLAYLMLTAKPHSREALAALFWPESDESSARANLRRTLYRLNKALGDEFLVSGDTISRNPEADIWIDVEAFQRRTEQAQDTGGEGARDSLREAAALYSDDFLAGFTLPDCPGFDEWQFFRREALRQTLANVLVRLIAAAEQERAWETAISYARRWLTLDPLHEPAHRALMRLYALSGQQAAALRQYEQCRELLEEELGVEPAGETVTLFEAIRSRELAPARPDAIPAATHMREARPAGGRPGNSKLPRALTSFVGRAAELADITTTLKQPECRLLTLLGPGGTGKTRLAVEAARALGDQFPDGVYWVDLQSVETEDRLAPAIADALSLPGRESPQEQVMHYLQNRRVLLVLDNFEQLLGGAELLTEILQVAAGTRLLVTSREALNLQEEWLYPLHGLPFPEEGTDAGLSPADIAAYDAVRLLVERVRRVRPDFSAEAEQAELVRICRLVGGMPLALELAASWARVLDCAAIAAEIEQNLAFLASSLRNVPARHRSMEAVFAHSWSLLEPDEQAAFRQLAIFRGGFRRKAAEIVAGATLPVLTALVDKSLLWWEASGRYQIHELLRQYAEKRLAEAPAGAEEPRQRHALYYTDFLHRRMADVAGGRQREAAQEIAAELENIRAAWQWAVDHRLFTALGRAIEPLAMFFHFKGQYMDAARFYTSVLSTLEEIPERVRAGMDVETLKALTLSEMGWIAIRLGQFEKAEAAFDDCQAVYDRLDIPPLPGLGTDPLLGLSTLASLRGDYPVAERLAKKALTNGTEQNQRNNYLNAAYQLAGIASAQGQYEAAQAFAEDACATAEALGDDWFLAYCLNELGHAVQAQGDYQAARRHFEASYAIRESMADPEGMALAMVNLGDIALRQQRPEQAKRFYTRSVAIYREIYDRGGLAAAQHGLGKTAIIDEDYEAAQEQLGEALQIASEIAFTPLTLAVLASAGELLLRTGRVEQGLPLLALVQAHPAAGHELRTALQRRWHHYRETLSPAQIEAAQITAEAAAQADELARATEVALQALSAPLPRVATRSAMPSPVPAPAGAGLVEPLTERELEVVQLLAQGLTNRQIAAELSVVVGTVKAHTNRIYGKLDVGNRVQAVTRARELGLLG